MPFGCKKKKKDFIVTPRTIQREYCKSATSYFLTLSSTNNDRSQNTYNMAIYSKELYFIRILLGLIF